jgi:hypothetical protein
MLKSQEEIKVDKVFINELQNANRKINCPHKTIKNYFKATVIHELAHMYDQLKKASDKPLFLNTVGLISKGVFIHNRTNLNQNLLRTPDRYELKNSNEAFAVNFEHFLYGQDYKCRRPLYYEYYANLFSFRPFSTYECKTTQTIFMNTGGGTSAFELDFNRLYQIHYLFAGNGKSAVSRFGHSMLRLVICAPLKAKGPSCLNDKAYHVVLSFRANVQELIPNVFKGMMGGYPSQLFFLPLVDVIDEYTKGEFRELKSIPLKLSDEQMTRFLKRSLELFWTYSGKYYFFTNNCATETLNLLRIAIGDFKDVQEKNILSPLGLYNYLVKLGIANDTVFRDLTKAETEGHYFPSATNKLLASLKALEIDESNFSDFFDMHSASNRMNHYLLAINKSHEKVKMGAHALRLENMIFQSESLNLNKLIISKFLINQVEEDQEKDQEIIQEIEVLKSLYSEISPKQNLKAGYGIPLENDLQLEESTTEKEDDLYDEINQVSEHLIKLTTNYFKYEINELNETKTNRQKILKIIGQYKNKNNFVQVRD